MKKCRRVIQFAVIALTSFAPEAAHSQQSLPPVRPPSVFDEGTGGKLTADQIRELLPWSFDSKTELKELLVRLPQLPPRQQQEALETELRRIVARSEGSRAALLMRYVINRGLLFSNEIAVESDRSAGPLTLDQQVRVLRASAEFAVKYAESDASFLKDGKVLPPYGAFGIEYAQYMMGLSQSILDASAQYRVIRLALGLLAWDLYQDERRLEHAPVIVKIQQVLDRNPEKAPSGEKDAGFLLRTRELRDAYERALVALGGQLDPPPVGGDPWAEGDASQSSMPIIEVLDPLVKPRHAGVGAYSDLASTGPWIDLAFHVRDETDRDVSWAPGRIRIGLGAVSDESGVNRIVPTYVDVSISYNRHTFARNGGDRHGDSAQASGSGALAFWELANLRIESYDSLDMGRHSTIGTYLGGRLHHRSEDLAMFVRGVLHVAFTSLRTDLPIPESSGRSYAGGGGGLAIDAGIVKRIPQGMLLRFDLSGSYRGSSMAGSNGGAYTLWLNDLLASVSLQLKQGLSLVTESSWQQAQHELRPSGGTTQVFERSARNFRVSLRYVF